MNRIKCEGWDADEFRPAFEEINKWEISLLRDIDEDGHYKDPVAVERFIPYR